MLSMNAYLRLSASYTKCKMSIYVSSNNDKISIVLLLKSNGFQFKNKHHVVTNVELMTHKEY